MILAYNWSKVVTYNRTTYIRVFIVNPIIPMNIECIGFDFLSYIYFPTLTSLSYVILFNLHTVLSIVVRQRWMHSLHIKSKHIQSMQHDFLLFCTEVEYAKYEI